ncbi:unnamed protein product [Cylindrotheca closterium]|uniref:Nudix hydrolase domain-containing protein n=1 Tax=Cylindrotheca closterium TaxID=2856 RepID=A0AAD2FAG4_9STRA|nr:unnamed protein product [Cylindrotheca closterium]
MEVEQSSNDDKGNSQHTGERRRIPRTFCVLVSLLVAYSVKEITFGAHLPSVDSFKSRTKWGLEEESMLVLHWINPELGLEKQHLESVDVQAEISTLHKKKYIPIDEIHKFGYIHTGAWMVVLDTNTTMQDAKILMLKRSAHVVTCPNYWSLLGEHSNRDEEPTDFAIRGMREEMGEQFYRQFLHTGGKIKPLLNHPIFFKRDYDTPDGKRMDRQINYIFTIEMNTPSAVLEKLSKVDNDAAEVAWVTKHEIEQWLTETENEKFCHNATRALVRRIMEELNHLEQSTKNKTTAASSSSSSSEDS